MNHADSPTVAAIATPNAPGGIGIVRISGSSAIFIANQVFRPKNCLDLSQLRGYSMTFGTIQDALSAENETIDEAICLVFRSPKSYTGEDVIELHCHGGQIVLRRVLALALAAGAELAGPGEFTRRAYLNGRIDLARAEAVMQLISAQSEQAARSASAAMGGALSRRIAEVRQSLVALAAQIAAWVDYPEEEFDDPQTDQIQNALQAVASQLAELIQRSAAGQAAISGVNTAIIGPPNAGKSSLMNLLVGYDRSIVTDIPGTTRDTVTETAQLGNALLRLTDTAGLRATDHPVERLGVARSQTALSQAELVLAVFDATAPLSPADHTLLAQCGLPRTVVIFNKTDLGCAATASEFTTVRMSALHGTGLDELAQAVDHLLNTADFSPNEAILSNERQSQSAKAALSAIRSASDALLQGYPLDAVAVCIEDAIQALYSLTGERAAEAIVDEVFSRFCVGK